MNIPEIKPLESWNLLEKDVNSILIDVRTVAEFNFTGIVDLNKINKKPILLPWRDYPEMEIDKDFNNKLTNILQSQLPDTHGNEINLLFLCRSGARSLEAAKSVSKLGYKCYNIANGFEGDVNKDGHRGKLNGWKAQNLSWRQG